MMKKIIKFTIASVFLMALGFSKPIQAEHLFKVYCINAMNNTRLCNASEPDFQKCEDSQILWNCVGVAIVFPNL